MGSFGFRICLGLVVCHLLPVNIPLPLPRNMGLSQSHLLLLFSVPIDFRSLISPSAAWLLPATQT